MLEAFMEAEEMFDLRMNNADVCLTDALTDFYESCNNSIFYEKQGDTLSVKIKKIVANMMTAITEFINYIKLQVNTLIQSSRYQQQLRQLHTKLKV